MSFECGLVGVDVDSLECALELPCCPYNESSLSSGIESGVTVRIVFALK